MNSNHGSKRHDWMQNKNEINWETDIKTDI